MKVENNKTTTPFIAGKDYCPICGTTPVYFETSSNTGRSDFAVFSCCKSPVGSIQTQQRSNIRGNLLENLITEISKDIHNRFPYTSSLELADSPKGEKEDIESPLFDHVFIDRKEISGNIYYPAFEKYIKIPFFFLLGERR